MAQKMALDRAQGRQAGCRQPSMVDLSPAQGRQEAVALRGELQLSSSSLSVCLSILLYHAACSGFSKELLPQMQRSTSN